MKLLIRQRWTQPLYLCRAIRNASTTLGPRRMTQRDASVHYSTGASLCIIPENYIPYSLPNSQHGNRVNVNRYIRPQVQILFPQEGLHDWQIGCLNQHDKAVDTA